jgi:hypothetical protein
MYSMETLCPSPLPNPVPKPLYRGRDRAHVRRGHHQNRHLLPHGHGVRHSNALARLTNRLTNRLTKPRFSFFMVTGRVTHQSWLPSTCACRHTECVLSLYDMCGSYYSVRFYYGMCSLTTECVANQVGEFIGQRAHARLAGEDQLLAQV